MLNNLLMLSTTRLMWLIRFTAFQGILLAGMLLTMEHGLLAAAVLLIKGVLLPGLLWRTRNRLHSHHRMRPRMHVAVGVLAGMGGLVLSLWLEARLLTLPALFPPLVLPTALTTLFCGLILVVGRTTALAQVIGYLGADNGSFLLGMPLMTAGTTWVELALLLDVFVAVFVMGIAINHIGNTFESIDVGRFRSLRD